MDLTGLFTLVCVSKTRLPPFSPFSSCLSDSDYKMFPFRHVFAAIALDPLDVNHKIRQNLRTQRPPPPPEPPPPLLVQTGGDTSRTRARTKRRREHAASHQRQHVVKRCFSSRRDFGDASIAVCCCVIAAFSVAEAVLSEDDSRLRPLSSMSRGARTPQKTLVKAISNQQNGFILFIGNTRES